MPPFVPLHAFALAALMLPVVAFAARPLVTEDAGVLDGGSCELEASGGRGRQDTREATFGLQVGCGLGHGLQAGFGAARSRESEEPSTRSVTVGAKAALPAFAGLDWAVAAALGHERAADGHSAELTATVVLAATGRLADTIAWHANLGWLNSRPARANTTTWNLAAEWTVHPQLDLTGESFGDDRQRPWVATGLRWNGGKAWNLNASWATQPTEPHARLWTVGAKLAF